MAVPAPCPWEHRRQVTPSGLPSSFLRHMHSRYGTLDWTSASAWPFFCLSGACPSGTSKSYLCGPASRPFLALFPIPVLPAASYLNSAGQQLILHVMCCHLKDSRLDSHPGQCIIPSIARLQPFRLNGARGHLMCCNLTGSGPDTYCPVPSPDLLPVCSHQPMGGPFKLHVMHC